MGHETAHYQASTDSRRGDFGLLQPITAGPLRALSSDAAVVAAIVEAEIAWVDVLEQFQLVESGSAKAVREGVSVGDLDAESLAVASQGGGNPVIPVVARWRDAITDPVAAKALHASLTSQDVLDTALMIVARNACQNIISDLKAVSRALGTLAQEHGATLQVARTLTQHSLPSTFAVKAAQWFAGVSGAGQKLGQLPLPVQFGGAAGTLAAGRALTVASAQTPFTLADAWAHKLSLSPVVAPWQSNRAAVTSLGDALTEVLDAAGKIANDVLLLSRPEFGELAEPRAAGRGVSSAMPQKQNPALSVLIKSAAMSAPQLNAQLHLASALGVDERSDGAWHSEWQALRALLSLGVGVSQSLRELSEGLQVFPQAMRRNLDISGPLLMSESLRGQLVPLLEDGNVPGSGRAKFQDLVEQALACEPATQGEKFAQILRHNIPSSVLSDEQLASLLDPVSYLGESATITERILAAHSDWTQAP